MCIRDSIGPVFAVACTVLDGRTVAVTTSWDRTVRVWDLATGLPVGEPLTGHIGPVFAVACTVLDGRTVAITTSQDNTVRVWDLATGRPVGEPLRGHTDNVYAVACTILDGRTIAVTTSQDDTVRVWDLRAQTAITVISIESPYAVSISATGDLIIGFHNDIAHYRRQPHDLSALT